MVFNTQSVQPVFIRFSDPGLNPMEFNAYVGGFIEQAFKDASALGYTSACVTIEGKDYWMRRFLGCDTWFPFILHQALEPYFSPEDV